MNTQIKDLKIVIDLKDLYTEYPDEENSRSDFNEVLKDEIEKQVIETMIRGFKADVTNRLKTDLETRFKEKFELKMSERINRAIDRGVFVDKTGKTFNITTLVKERFEREMMGTAHFTKALNQEMKKQIAQMLLILKERYDLQFASGIIQNIKDAGLLKEGAGEMLLKGIE